MDRRRFDLKRFFLLDDRPGRNLPMEGLRAYAALIVFVGHLVSPYLAVVQQVDFEQYADWPLPALAAQVPWSTWGMLFLQCNHHGVDLFFLLSGFLIYRIRARTPNRFSYPRFLWMRFLRIYPAFLLSLLAYAWFCIWRRHWFAFDGWEFVQNLLFLNGCPSLSVRSYNMVSWSLFYEFFFYLVFPGMFLAIGQVRDGTPPRQFVGAAGLLTAVLFLQAWLPRFSCFYFGILLGMCSEEGLTRIARALPTWLVAACYVAVVAPFRMGVMNPVYFWPLFGLASTLLFIKSCYGEGLLRRLFGSGPLRFLGNISYSFYLIHPLSYWVASRWIDPLVRHRSEVVALPLFFGGHLLVAVAGSVVLFAVAERWYFGYAHRFRPARALPEGGELRRQAA